MAKLRHLRLLKVVFCTVEHKVGDVETEDFVCLVEELSRFGVVFVEVFTHAYELSALAGKTYAFILLDLFFFLKLNSCPYGSILIRISHFPGAKLTNYS